MRSPLTVVISFSKEIHLKLLRPIILEGPDGAGKTQLYNRMTQEWLLKAAGHDGGPPADAADAWKRLAMTAAQTPAVRDRTPAISDPIYSGVFHRDPVLTRDEYEGWLEELRPVIIYCRPPNNVILNQEVRAKLHKPEAHVSQVKLNRMALIHAYDLYMGNLQSRTSCEVLAYNWTHDPDALELNKWLDWSKTCVE